MMLSKVLPRYLLKWLLQDPTHLQQSNDNLEWLQNNIQFCDVLLIRGYSQISKLIQFFTRSPWSHAALYIGDLNNITNPALQQLITENIKKTDYGHQHYVVEGVLGRGFVITPLEFYQYYDICICRPSELSKQDALTVATFALNKLSKKYSFCSSIIAQAFGAINYGKRKKLLFFSPNSFCYLTDFKLLKPVKF